MDAASARRCSRRSSHSMTGATRWCVPARCPRNWRRSLGGRSKRARCLPCSWCFATTGLRLIAMRILVAEDDQALQQIIALGLRDSGYHVDAVDRGDDAIDQLRWYDYDVAVIDWRMPGKEGIDVVAWARRNDKPTALLMLTARDSPADRIRGLDMGADDYLVKPFDFGELLARVRALQRRPRGVTAPVLEIGRVKLDPARRTVEANDAPLSLTSTEYLILELLMRRAPAVVDRKQIAEHAWADETDPLGSNAIDVQLSRLRDKIPNAGIRIVTVRGAGYRLEAE